MDVSRDTLQNHAEMTSCWLAVALSLGNRRWGESTLETDDTGVPKASNAPRPAFHGCKHERALDFRCNGSGLYDDFHTDSPAPLWQSEVARHWGIPNSLGSNWGG
jgi:hypothetical protein